MPAFGRVAEPVTAVVGRGVEAAEEAVCKSDRRKGSDVFMEEPEAGVLGAVDREEIGPKQRCWSPAPSTYLMAKASSSSFGHRLVPPLAHVVVSETSS